MTKVLFYQLYKSKHYHQSENPLHVCFLFGKNKLK
jgi:hypothetical protein